MRTNRTRDEWNSILGAQARSGLSQNEFCRKRGVTPSAFSNAKQRISAGQAHKSAFVPVLPPQPRTEESTRADTGSAILAELPSGRAAISPSQTVSPISVLLPGATLCLSADISHRWLANANPRDGTMKMFVDAPAIYLYPGQVDFRKSINNGLALIVEQEGTYSPFDEALFVFCNRNRDKVKALYWDKSGFCLWYKRLEKDFFRWPKVGQQAVQLTEEQWRWLLAGVDLDKMRPHPPLNCAITR